jgi:predicted heme/steroid binding protein
MRRIVSAVAVVMLLVAITPAASATEARSQSLLYNLAFEDQTDVFLFPQLLPVYEGAYFHLPVNNPGGVFGGLILGMGDGALGVFIHRPVSSAFDQYRIGVTDDPGLVSVGVIGGSPSAAVEPHISGQIFDIMYGARSWGIGLRMHLFSDISVQYAPLADGNPATARFAGELNAGFNFSPGFDMRVNAGIVHDEDVSNLILFRVGLRYLDQSEKRMRLVIASELQVGFLVPDADVDTSIGFALPFKGGVLFNAIPGKLQFSLLGGIDIQMLKILDEDMRFGVAFPTLELAGEWQALSWMHVRTAIKGGWGILLATPADANPKYEQMVFSSGVGFPLGPFCLDAVIQYSFWNNGPWFLSGNGGLFAGVSLSYRWGDGAPGRSGGSSAGSDDGWGTPKAAKPRPEPKPKPKPAPVETKPAPVEEKPAEEKKPEEKKEGSFEGWEEE